MAELAWNADIRITDLSLVATNPGQIVHEIPSTGSVKTFNRGVGRWSGTITFGQLENMVQGQNVEAFIAALNGSQNTTRIPLAHIKGFRNQSASPIPFNRVEAGKYYNYGSRLILSNGGFSVFPEIPIGSSEMVTPATFIRIRQAPAAQVLLRHRPDSFGPWTLSFVEALT